MTSATNLIKVSGFVINQYLNLTNPNENKTYDSTKYNRNIGLGRINHHFSYQRNRYVYEDKKPMSSFYQNYDIVLDSLSTSDSVYFHTVKNVIYWNTLGYKKYNNDVPFYLTFGLEHNFTYHVYNAIVLSVQSCQEALFCLKATKVLTIQKHHLENPH